ncbi:sensor domain-containing diguanylate cyclase [Pseudidiomarina aquimaris]|uniref:Sensor domain-containing diguanylate cyclase n=1 Tax=Pseudidiomarina aquimaris TaxID=641841 RepID=A0A432XHV8_9GAMM|nr:GGDEF domain-containing protein [Pseudidiomarina aquimaris]RUO48222.1 sensor domain-containing diguanylate cyclase [Pseudidiomarina aquimaris]
MDWQRFLDKMPGLTYQIIREPSGHFRFTHISANVEEMLGFSPQLLTEDARPLLDAIHPEDVEEVIEASILSAQQHREWHHPFRFIRPDGKQLWLDAHDSGEELDDGTLVWTGYIVEATHRKQLELDLIASEQRFQTLVKNASDIIFTLDANGTIGYLSPNWRRIVGDEQSDPLYQSYTTVVHQDDLANCNAFIQSLLNDGPLVEDLEFRVRHNDGEWHWYTCRAAKVDGRENDSDYLLGIAREITEQREQREKMARLARQDMLTNLPNRASFDEAFELALRHCEQRQRALAVLFIDLDNFKPVNDQYGHSVGDQLLIHVARRIKACLRDSDLACRIGGDEFLVLTEAHPQVDSAKSTALAIAERLRDELAKPFAVEHLQLEISASIGVAIYPTHATGTGELVRCADRAMYEAKLQGRNCVVFSQC